MALTTALRPSPAWISHVRRASSTGGAEGYLVWGGNDTDTDSVLTLEVLCLTP